MLAGIKYITENSIQDAHNSIHVYVVSYLRGDYMILEPFWIVAN